MGLIKRINLQMKTFAIAMLAASTAALDMEFFRGCQTGVFIMSDKQIESYECPAATIAPEITPALAMAKPAIQMIKNMAESQGKTTPHSDFAETAIDKIAIMYSLIYGYEGSSYCSGLIFSHEAAKIAMMYGKTEMSKYFPMLEKLDVNN